MRFTVDSNVLIYAVDHAAPDKHRTASELMIRAVTADAVLTAQALGEFLNVVRRKRLADLPLALEQVSRWMVLFPIAPTTSDNILAGARFAEQHRLQFWDCVIWQTASTLKASYFLSEDLQDGLSLEGMTVLNPFKSDNQVLVETLLA